MDEFNTKFGMIAFLREHNCELCDKACSSHTYTKYNLLIFDCPFIKKLIIDKELYRDKDKELRHIRNLIFSDIIRRKEIVSKPLYYTNSENPILPDGLDIEIIYINKLQRTHPILFIDEMDQILLNLYYLYKKDVFYLRSNTIITRALMCNGKDCDLKLKKSQLVDFDYIKLIDQTDSYKYCISKNGWLKIKELLEDRSNRNQGFIALKFGEETQEISKVIENCIKNCEFVPVRIDHLEHNNQIVPEIFHQIRKSRFLVMDVTYPNYGAYYEAGIARGANIEVIITCNKDIFNGENRPHFDIAQQSIVLWSDLEELNELLKKRIEITIL